MRSFYLFFFLFSVSQGISAQTCLPDGIDFETQADVDQFPSLYPGCTEILGNVDIEETIFESIRNLDSLSQVTKFSGSLWIQGNDALTSVEGLENVQQVGGSLAIVDNDSLANLNGMNNISYAASQLRITFNNVLTDLTGLESLQKVDGIVVIELNRDLASLAGLEQLDSIGAALKIVANNSLTDISALANLDPTTINTPSSQQRDLSILDNPLLRECAIQSICDFFDIPGRRNNISDNGVGCSSEGEIVEACALTSTRSSALNPLSIYPNPAHNALTISGLETSEFHVFNALGEIVHSENAVQSEARLDIRSWTSGIYFVRSEHGFAKFVVRQ